VNIDPLKSSPSETTGNVSKRGRITNSQTMSTGTSTDSELDNISQEGLLDLVKDMPDVRSEVVSEVGQKLANDPSYPTDEMVEKFASLLADADTSIMDSIDAETDDGNENA
jgi:hypothetical protein